MNTSRALLAAALVASLAACAASPAPAPASPAPTATPAPGAFGPFVVTIPEGYRSRLVVDGELSSLMMEGERSSILAYSSESQGTLHVEAACHGRVLGFATGWLRNVTGHDELELDEKRFELLPARPGFSAGCQLEASVKQGRSDDKRAISSRMLAGTQDAGVLCMLDVTDARAVADCQAVLASLRLATR